MLILGISHGFRGRWIVAIEIRCPNGHVLRVKDECAGKTGLCSRCRAKVRVPISMPSSEDDSLSSDEDIHHELRPENNGSESGLIPLGSSYILKKTRLCPECGKLASPSFSICPRCGTPLPSRTIEPLAQ